MPDVSITAANVVASAASKKKAGLAGAAIVAGQVVHISPSTGRYILSDADAAGINDVKEFAIALNGAANSQPLQVATLGDVTLGGGMTAGTSYYVSPNPGGIAPLADILAGDRVILLGVAKSTTVLALAPIIPGVTL